jgi:hypothetical protein
MRGALPPSGFSRCSGDDHAILPASVRAIADALAHGDDLALLEKLGGVCLRTAVEEYVTLLAAGVQTDELFVALGRVSTSYQRSRPWGAGDTVRGIVPR